MIESLIADPEKAGVIGLLVLAVASLMRGWVIPGFLHDRMMKHQSEAYERELSIERETSKRWERLAHAGFTTANTATEVTKKVIQP